MGVVPSFFFQKSNAIIIESFLQEGITQREKILSSIFLTKSKNGFLVFIFS